MRKKILYLLAVVALASAPLADLFARDVAHGDWYFREERGGTQYSAYSIGSGKVHYKILVFASGTSRNFWAYQEEEYGVEACSRCWTHLDGAADYPNFLIYEADNNGHNRPQGDRGSNPNDRGWVRLKVLSGSIIVTNTYDGEPDYVSADGQWHEFYLKRQGTADWLTYLEFDWIEPVEFANKVYWVGNSVRYRREGGEPGDQARGEQTRTLAKLTGGNSDPAPQLQTPFLYVMNENGTTGFGKIAVPYVSVQKPYNYWVNGTGDAISCEKNADLFYVNSDDVVRGFFVTMETQRSQDSLQTQIQNSNTVNILAYHKVHDFAIQGIMEHDEATGKWFKDERMKQISWKIYNPGEQDIMPSDMFEVQRAYSADYSDATTIAVIPMMYDSETTDTLTNQQTYTYLDTVEAAWYNPVEKSYKIYYRVRRVSSSQWGWDAHEYAAAASFESSYKYSPWPFANTLTYRLADDFETSHQVDFSFYLPNMNYNRYRTETGPGYSRYYMDPNQRFMLRKILTELGDTIEVEIPRDSVQKAIDAVKYHENDSIYYNRILQLRYTDVVTTPCIHYKYEVYIDTTGVTVPNDSTNYGVKPVSPSRTKDTDVYFTEAANLNALSASKLEFSDGVLLRWETTDGNVGTYRIETRPAGKDTAWTVLEDNYEDSWYRDRTANPFVSPEWEYRLTMTYECNGNVKTAEATAVGSRSPYGKVSGYVRYEDGTACPGIKVVGSRTSDGEIIQTVVTDQNGYYLLDSLLYGEGYPYAITPTSEKAQFTFNNTSANNATVTLGLDDCIKENVNFANISSVRLTGRVLYENSTVPARDVNFKLNGIPVMNGSALYKTDASGNFELRVPENDRFTLQAFKEGHTFLNDGFIKMDDESEDSTLLLVKALDDVRITDLTKVRLIGRLAGGRIQAEKPLGFGVSQNNIGEDLKIVFELEGDNISQIVHFEDDLTLDSAVVNLPHEVRNGDQLDSVGTTRTEYYKKRIIIYPDVNTGEYYVDLFPVKYKITQATAKGYATLYAEGKTSETLDLTNAPLQHRTNTMDGKEVDYNETYNITYRSPITVSYTQMQYGMPLDYYGIKDWSTKALNGEDVNVELVSKDTTGLNNYLFGAPVFPVGNYQFQVSAHENYYYNNERTRIPEIVYLTGGNLKVYNGMRKTTDIFTMPLDSKGSALITATIDHVTFVQSGDNALHSLDFSVESEGAYINAEPLRAYVLGAEEKAQDILETDTTATGITLLDILRDPPGSGSFATLAAGTKYHVSYKQYFNYRFGINLKFTYGNNTQYFVGSYAGTPVGGTTLGMINVVQKTSDFTLPISVQYTGSGKADYDFTTASTISTGNDPLSVGAMADVYIGVTNGVMTGKADAFRIVDSVSYELLQGQIDNRNVRVVKQGTDAAGRPWYLMRTEDVLFKQTILSSFSYTQEHILTSVIPELYYHLKSLLLTGSREDAVALAESTQKPVYWSMVGPEDEHFGLNAYYEIIKPEGYTKPVIDQISADYRAINNWIGVIATNEAEKVNTLSGTPLQTLSLSSGVTQSYSESYAYSDFRSAYVAYPWNALQSGEAQRDGMGGFAIAFLKDKLFPTVWSQIDDYLTAAQTAQASGGDGVQAIQAEIGTAKFGFEYEPIFDFNKTLPENEETTGASKTTGYTISLGVREHLTFNVYKSKTDDFNAESKDTRTTAHDIDGGNKNKYLFGSLMYQTLGGASECPWEGADSTLFYHSGTPLNAATQKIENPQIVINRHDMSDIPHDQPAVFTVTMWNETDETVGLPAESNTTFILKQDELTNAQGVKISIDGTPLGDGREFRFSGNTPVIKTIEVRAGEDYDYEDVCLVLESTCMPKTTNQKACFSVHYMPVACPVNISAPHANWIMNTLSPQDSAGWYMPVVIDGFDVNYKNFDHIEFQYKLSTHSDDDWVNLCSYYADDSLYNEASGNKAMITSGRIENVRFYGERDPMEQQYDLRAVAFCRHGSSFITRPSAVLRGVKDTRVPRVFGKAAPTNSVLTGDNQLLLRFNEPIAGNYLDKDNNFQVVGYTNTTGLLASTSVFYAEAEKSYANSLISRNLSAKSFTIDLMVKPSEDGTDAVFFEHGDNGLKFGIKAGTTLYMQFGDEVITAKPLDKVISGFTRVAAVYNHDTQKVLFYVGTENVSLDLNGSDAPAYTGKAQLIFGRGFKGNMLEARLWTKALTQEEISDTYMVQMTGNERKLADYYPMNEGKGFTLNDKANGAHLLLHNGSWTTPDGISLAFDGTRKGIKLKDELLSRSAAKDMTLMFWFRAESLQGDTVALLTAGNQDASTGEALGTFIGFRNGELYYSNDRLNQRLAGSYADGAWHSFVLTVNRTFNATAIYIDGKLISTILSDKVGSFSGSMYLGSEGLTGNLDNFVLFEQALPQNLIEQYDNVTPAGDEMGLMALLTFSEDQENSSGIIRKVFSPNDQRVFKTSEGVVVEGKVQPLIDSAYIAQAKSQADFDNLAPAREKATLSKMNFDWAYNNDELMINLNMFDYEINKQNIQITVRDVEDLNGNPMENPVTWTVFVNKNRLKWAEKNIEYILDRDEYSESVFTFKTKIINTSGERYQFTIDDLPAWLTCSEASGTLDPEEERTLTFTVNAPNMNVGEYSELIYLTDMNNLSEPLMVDIAIEAHDPWQDADFSEYPTTMNIRAQVYVDDKIDTDAGDIVAAFMDDVCVGQVHIDVDEAVNETFVYLTIHGSDNMTGENVAFRLWQASTGKILPLIPSAAVTYKANTTKGYSPEEPMTLSTSSKEMMNIQLAKGWNWVSLYKIPASMEINNVLPSYASWNRHDQVKSSVSLSFSEYNRASDDTTHYEWYGTVDAWSWQYMYMLLCTEDVTDWYLIGDEPTAQQRTIALRKGWNSVPYMMSSTKSITDAFADYYDNASVGDIIKNRTAIAVFTESGKWKGSLQTLKPGEGYLFYRVGEGTVNMVYPENKPQPVEAKAPRREAAHPYATNMVVFATAEVMPVAHANGIDYMPEEIGDGQYLFLIGGEDAAEVTFTLNGETAEQTVGYEADKIVGTVQNPLKLTVRQASDRAEKILINDHVFIRRDGKTYSILGQETNK